MALTRKQKNFINQNYQNLSIKEISQILYCSENEVLDYLRKFNLLSNPKSSKASKNIFTKDSVAEERFEYKGLFEILEENFGFFIIIFIFLFVLYWPSFNSILLSDEITVFNTGILNKTLNIANSFYNTSFIHVLNFYIFGLNGLGFRVVSLILHFINIVLFFYIFRNFFSENVLKIAIVLLSAHSLISESIIWISANPYIYMATLYLVSSALSIKFKETKSYKYLILSYIPIIILSVSGGHSNFAPLFYIFFNLFILKNNFKHELKFSFWLLLLIPVYGILNRSTVDQRIASLTTGPYFEKFTQTLPFTVAKSLELVVFPYNLALFHEETLTPDYYVFARIFTILFILSFVVLFFKNKFYFGILSLAFIYNIYMFSPVQISWFVAERYMYFTIFIYCLLLGVLLEYIYHKKNPYLSYLLLSLFFTFLVVRTVTRFEDWKTNVSLWSANVKISPDSHRVRNNLADSLVKEKRYAEAEEHFIHSIKLNPNFAEAYMNLGNSYLQQGKLIQAEQAYLKSLELNGGLVDSYLNLGIIYANSKDFSKAYSAIDKVILMAPTFEQAKNIRKEIEKYENTLKKN
jgi:hypothetical protein